MKKILVVEDDASSLYMLSFLLSTSDYQVIEAQDGEEGINKARELIPDIIIMDVQMPKIDGLKATKIIKNDELLKNIPVIVLTAFAMKGDEEKVFEAGADGYIKKPINSENFISEMEAIIESFNKRYSY